MPEKQNDTKTGPQTAGKIAQEALDDLGLRFKGMISSIGKQTEWTAKDRKTVLGTKFKLQISTGDEGYTYSYKVPEGEKPIPLRMLQIVEIKNVRVMEDMGLSRILGDLVA